MQERYINPFTDFGFKKLFGEDSSKDILIAFLGALLPEQGNIKEINFVANERLGASQTDRKAVFDLYCENDKGEKFIVELQKAKQEFFKDRSLYYATFPVQEQANVGDWNFKINTVYTICIMDFVFDNENPDLFLRDVRLVDVNTQKVFSEKLRFLYLEMPKFQKKEKELVTNLDKWLFVLNNLYLLDKIPAKIKEKIFLKFFEKAEIAKYTPVERDAYQQSVKVARDFKNVVETGIKDGIEIGIEIGIKDGIEIGIKDGIEIGIKDGIEIGIKKGILEGVQKTALLLKQQNVNIEVIMQATGLSEIEIKNL